MIIGIARTTLLATTTVCVATASPATAQTKSFDVPAQPVQSAIGALGRQANIQIIAARKDSQGKRANAVRGNMTVEAALAVMLRGTGLTAKRTGPQTYFVVPVPSAVPPQPQSRTGRLEEPSPGEAEAGSAAADSEGEAITVTGSRIRGNDPASPVISATRKEIERRGHNDLGAFVRDLPQNFSGGQNPGVVGGGGQGGSENLNSSSTLNLRGLGADATLTLLNGHRLAYDGATQGIDISAIPLAAIERVEIVADGASAIYGSDAVGGVANVVLRRDFDGLSTSARVGASTDGGNTQQQYGVVAGKDWQSGGLLVALDYSRATEVLAGQRDYATSVNRSATLIPGRRQVSAVLAGHQDLLRGVTLDLDAQYSRRTSRSTLPSQLGTDVYTNGIVAQPRVRSYSVTPSLRIALPAHWKLSLTGMVAGSLSNAPSTSYSGGNVTSRRQVRYDNSVRSIEAYAEGPLFALPGGDARLVAGAGYRSATLDMNSSLIIGTTVRPLNVFGRKREVIYGFGEVSLPLIGPANDVPLVQALQLTGAVRYEDYNGMDGVASPRIGLVYRPTDGVAFKASWGKSFKAPTFYDQYRVYQVLVLSSASFGPSSALPDQTVVYLAGGNPNLKPERATTWSATLELKPAFLEGLRIEASYFDIRYRDRVVTPIASSLGVFNNPIYQHLIDYSPTSQQIDALAAGAVFGLENYSGQPYDPAKVYAILNGNVQNSARDTIHGVDLSVRYGFDAGPDRFDLSAAASYLKSDRDLVAGLPTIQRAGIIFNPPHWRVQGGGSWERGILTLSAFASHIGGTLDNRIPPHQRVGSFTSVDAIAQIRTGATSGILKDVAVTFSLLNAFNEKPAPARSSSVNDPAYDSTNYPSIGRFVSFGVSKSW